MEEKKNYFILAASASLIIIALSIAYYLIIFLPKKEEAKVEKEWQIRTADLELKQTKQNSFESCLDTAYSSYITTWNIRCKDSGKENNCTLPSYLNEDIEVSYNQDQELCVKKWK